MSSDGFGYKYIIFGYIYNKVWSIYIIIRCRSKGENGKTLVGRLNFYG